MGALIDLTGQRFGRWLVLNKTNRRVAGQLLWRCRCDCGAESDVSGANLRRGLSLGCGCARGRHRVTHGHASRRNGRSREYRAWLSMKCRCLNERTGDPNYRGIPVCPRWSDSFEAFLADMGECPKGLTLDRIDNNRGYEPGNCRWATYAEQNRNTCRNRWVLLGGERMVLGDAIRLIGVTYAAIYQEMRRRNLPLQEAVDRVATRHAS